MTSLARPHNLELLASGQDLDPHRRHQGHTTATPHSGKAAGLQEGARALSKHQRALDLLPLDPPSLTFTPPPSSSLLLPGWRVTVAAKLPSPRRFCPGACASAHFPSHSHLGAI